MGLVAVTLPTRDEILALVSIADMKTELGITNSRHDAMIGDKIVAAYQWLDGPLGWLRRAILTQEWKLTGRLLGVTTEFKLSPVQSIDRLRYRDASGTFQTVDPALYTIDDDGVFPTLRLQSGTSFSLSAFYSDSCEITGTFGFGDAADVRLQAEGIRRAVMVLAAEYFYHRAASDDGEGKAQKKAMYGVEHAAGRWRVANDH